MPASNPNATGPAGPAFETKVAAACLTLLLTRGAPLCLGAGTLRSVHLQAGHLGLGWRTDDLVLEATNIAGEGVKAALQAKRTFLLSATDTECVQAPSKQSATDPNPAEDVANALVEGQRFLVALPGALVVGSGLGDGAESVDAIGRYTTGRRVSGSE